MHLRHHRPQRPFLKSPVGVDQCHRNDGNLCLHGTLKTSRLEFSHRIVIFMIAAFRKNNESAPFFRVLCQLPDDPHRLPRIVLDQPFSMDKINKLLHQNAMRFRVVYHHRAGLLMGVHDPQSIILALMVRKHHIAALLGQMLRAVFLCRDMSRPHHAADRKLRIPVALLFRVLFPVPGPVSHPRYHIGSGQIPQNNLYKT